MAAFTDGPGMDDDHDEVFRVLADPSRRRLLDSLNQRDGQTLRELCAGLETTRQSISKHLATLEASGVITTERRGREKLHHLNAAPINAIADRWIRRYDRPRARALAELKSALEEATPLADNDFHYTTHIRTTPEKLWRALTELEFTRQYWGVEFDTDWTPGSTMTWTESGNKIVDADQVVLEADPPHRLSYTWHTFTTDWARSVGVVEPVRAALAAEPRSTVTFEIEPAGETVKLTVTHGGFPPESTVREMVGEGWPQLLSSLKTLLETGEALPG